MLLKLLHKRNQYDKVSCRNAKAVFAGGTPVVLELHTKVETLWLQPVTQVIELHVVPTLPTFPGLGNETVILNDTAT